MDQFGTGESGHALAVIVCCYTVDRLPTLTRGLDAVRAQQGEHDELIVVVDHNEQLLEQLRSALPDDVAVVPNSHTRGLSGARNSGADRASAGILVFLDDDAVIRPGSLEAVRAAFGVPTTVAVGGAVHAHWESGRSPSWFPDEFGWVVGCDYRGMAADGAVIRNPIGAAMAVRRDALTAIGGFSDRLGRVGTLPAGCEETLMGIALTSRYPDSAIVRITGFAVDHEVPAGRGTLRYFLSRCRHEGRSKAVLASMVGPGAGLSAERSYVLRTLSTGILRYLRQFATTRPDGRIAPVTRIVAMMLGLLVTAAGTAAGAVAARKSNAAAFEPAADPLRPEELVSVVVPTVGRASLADTVRAVLEQKHREIELLVVDNRPSSGAVAELMSQFTDPRIRVLAQPVPGVSAARNLGADRASGRIVAFTDDDAVPDPLWITTVLDTLRLDGKGRVGAVTGRVLGTDSATPEQAWFEEAGVFDKGEQPTVWAMEEFEADSALGTFGAHGPFFPYTAGECGTGNNMAFRIEALRSVHGFDERLGTGTPTHGGEDLDIYRSALLHGWAIAYAPGAIVRHYHRDNLADLRVQSYGYGTGMAASLTKLLFSGQVPPWTILGRIPRGLHMLLSPHSTKNENIPAEWPTHLRLLEVWGYLIGPALYLRSHLTVDRTGLLS
ncbi:glycosyltransferase family 2 protein [Rhodococcus triatomae]|nr:glycosyltransferase family 2 protein [Rhodococcus triatomae]QNG25524.1 glycosyltransferase family 2 protein [Rhodococcus triatomae]